ncbi:hypothetical protein PRZ48_010994 [Zasmidium cellare]|uniref:Uncharacterized protein n=1 Tax=Zasmidium cellare TaxID=395010 RepID=A0ABR0EAS1_ZASCE|nr:hypothetical protein PRZ48_010994 [Zasmidium cellare]
MLWQTTITALAASLTAVTACTNCTNESTEPYTLAPAPWTLKGTIYTTFLLPGVGILLDGKLPNKAFPPLERQYPESIAGKFVGTLGTIQIIRYTESPVGPYDEMFIIPGFFEYENEGKVERNVRVSRIYVSQKYCVWNARKIWNQPKHLANFDWTTNADGSESVKVYPYDTTGDETESHPSTKPWFQMVYSFLLPENLNLNLGILNLDLDLNPEIPFSSDLYGLLGINATLIQPPLPQGNDSFGALASGGEFWKSVVPGQFSDKTSVGTMNLDQSGGDGEEESVNAVGDEFEEAFWPGLLKTSVALKMEDATLTFSEERVLPEAE